jgi:antitoxin CptB
VALPSWAARKRPVHRAFFARHESGFTVRQARAWALMDLSDNDLLDLLLRRKEPQGALAADEVLELLALLRTARCPMQATH